MTGPHMLLTVAGGVLAMTGLAVALPAAWSRRVAGASAFARLGRTLEPFLTFGLLTFVLGAVLVALPYLLPVPVGGASRDAEKRPLAPTPLVPNAPGTSGGGTNPTSVVGQPTRKPVPTATRTAPSPAPTRPPPTATRVTAGASTPTPSPAYSIADLSGRWNHDDGWVELRATASDRYAFQDFDTQGRLVAEGTAVRRGNALTLAGTVPGLGFPISGEFQVVSASLIEGALRDPLGNSIPLVLTR